SAMAAFSTRSIPAPPNKPAPAGFPEPAGKADQISPVMERRGAAGRCLPIERQTLPETNMARPIRFRRPSVIPGFGLTLGFTIAYFSLIVLIPMIALVVRSAGLGWGGFWAAALDPRVLAALRTSFLTALIAAGVNVVFGTLIAWVLVRYRFPGRRLFDAMVDLPFALPTAVAGIALTAIYAPNGFIGQLAAS